MGHGQLRHVRGASRTARYTRAAACVVAALAVGGGWSPADSSPPTRGERSLPGFTTPFRSATFAAEQTGQIGALPLEEGQSASAGQVLVAMDDGWQRTRTEMTRQLAESVLDVELAQIRNDRAATELARLESLKDDSMASDKEINDARSEAELNRVTLALARFKHEQNQLDYELQTLMLERLHIRAPFDGYLAKRFKDVGETVPDGEGIVLLVQLDPLLVIVDCPLTLAGSIQLGDNVPITPVETQWEPRLGEVIFIDRVADAASQTLRVKLRVDNHDLGWLSGMKVFADLGAAEPANPDANAPLRTPTVREGPLRTPAAKVGARPADGVTIVRGAPTADP